MYPTSSRNPHGQEEQGQYRQQHQDGSHAAQDPVRQQPNHPLRSAGHGRSQPVGSQTNGAVQQLHQGSGELIDAPEDRSQQQQEKGRSAEGMGGHAIDPFGGRDRPNSGANEGGPGHAIDPLIPGPGNGDHRSFVLLGYPV